MEKSIIEQIFLENEGFQEKIKPSKEYKKRLKKCFDLLDELSATLDDGEKKDLNKLFDLHTGVCSECEIMSFKEGVKFGLRLAIECLY